MAEQGREQHRHPEQAGRRPGQHVAVGVEGEGEQHEDEQGERHDLVDADPRPGLDPQVLAGHQHRVTPH